jgi:hypothetical protein
MADQATETPTPEAAEDQSQSTTGAPEQDQRQTTESPEYFSDQFDVNTLDEPLQGRYREMEAGLTKKFQEVAEQRKQAERVQAAFTDLQSEDPEAQQAALEWLTQSGLVNQSAVERLLPAFGYQFDDQEGDSEPEPFLTRQEWEQYQAQRQQAEAKSAEEAYISQVDEHLAGQMEHINAQLKKQGRDELSEAEQQLIVKNALVDTQPGQMPDVNAAYEQYTGLIDGRLKGWASTKQGGATRPGGAAATGVPDMDNMTGDERRAWQAQRLRELNEQAGP